MSDAATGRFELLTNVTQPEQLRVLKWTCQESICGGYQANIQLAAKATEAEPLAQLLLGQTATLVLRGTDPPIARRGVITAAGVVGDLERERSQLSCQLVPLLDVMKLKTTSRIFTDKSTPEIVALIADEWKLAHDLRLRSGYDKRPYTTQYRESDFDFLIRICGRDGIGFFLDHATVTLTGDNTGDTLVLYDNAGGYSPIAPGQRGSVLVHHAQNMHATDSHVLGFRLERNVLPELVQLGDFDFRKPRLPLRAQAALVDADKSPIGSSLAEQLSVYLHADRTELESDGSPGLEIGEALAAVRLEQTRRDAVVARGSSSCQRLAPGLTFTLEDHPGGELTNREWVVTSVEHSGRIPESGDSDDDSYGNTFCCVPADVVYRVAFVGTSAQQAVETATVVGPPGTEVHCDEHGRIQVKLHWERADSGDDTDRSWLRVSQPWAGAHWGAQFLPRVGSEVIVGFLGGDVDRPIVLGGVYNGTHPYPFRLPEEAHKSGIRSNSTPGGAGHSEIVFDDNKGEETLSISAERNLTELVEHDYQRTVKGSQQVGVDGSSQRTVGVDELVTVLGDRNEMVSGDMQVTVKGSHGLSVSGNADLRVTGDRAIRIEGRDGSELFGESEQVFRLNRTERVLGHSITIVGQHDARRSATLHVEGRAEQYSTGTTEIVSDKEIVLRCGNSDVRIGPDSVQINAPELILRSDVLTVQGKDEINLFSDEQVAVVAEKFDVVTSKSTVVKSEGAQLQLDRNARLDGEVVKLNCKAEPVDDKKAPDYEPPKPTTITLVDEDGNALGHRRYRIIEPDGSERSGMLDADGKAEVFLDGSAQIAFPDVDQARKN